MRPEPLPEGVTADHVVALIEKLRRIPDDVRQFNISPDQAWQLFRVSGQFLEYLRDHGLASRGTGGNARFDLTDMRNIAIRMGSSARAARRFWAAGMNRGRNHGPAHYEIEYRVSCPDPDHGGTCHYRFLLPAEGWKDMDVPAGEPAPAPTTRVSIEPEWPELPSEARELMDTLRGIEFMRLPGPLREDLDFIRHARLGDCLGTTRYLVGEGRRRGMPIRARYGIMVVLPFSNRHNWAEYRVDDRWVPVDPVLLTWMLEWGVVDPAHWNAHRSPGAILVGITERKVPLALHNGIELLLTLSTRRVREDEPSLSRP